MKRFFTLILSIFLLMLFLSSSHARYYDPKIGRYLRADPIGLEGGINLYVYSHNNPVNYIDPYGLLTENHYLSHGYSPYDVDYGGAWVGAPRKYDYSAKMITDGQAWAAGKVVGGTGLIVGGAVTLPEGAWLIRFGIPILADGIASSLAEVIGIDTSDVPPTMTHITIEELENELKSKLKPECE